MSYLTSIPLHLISKRKGGIMPNRKRNHQVCLRLTDEENVLFEKRCNDSGLTKTEFLVSVLKNSTVKIFCVDEAICPLMKELRYIGSNINQLAYFSNIGQEYKVRQEIESIRRKHNLIMEEISDFLKNPKFNVNVR